MASALIAVLARDIWQFCLVNYHCLRIKSGRRFLMPDILTDFKAECNFPITGNILPRRWGRLQGKAWKLSEDAVEQIPLILKVWQSSGISGKQNGIYLSEKKKKQLGTVRRKRRHRHSMIFIGMQREHTKRKLIAVELAPPMNADDEKIMEAAHYLQNHDVDVLTFPDSPSGRTRADAILMAEKVSKETEMCVMPHICCRDRNAIAIRSEFLGAQMNGIYNFLVITGDPVPAMARQTVKSVFQFDSVGMMRIIQDMNEESFDKAPLCYGGAINQNRRNLEVEISRVRKKIESGASFFLTQPVFTMEQAQRLRRIKKETGTRILCGIMPLVSRKNALFMKNEMSGIDIPQELIERYPENGSREDGEKVAVQIAREMMELVDDFADGYYFSFPFNRVYLLEQIMK